MDRWSLVTVGCLLLAACRSGPEAVRYLTKAVWVDRWDWRTAVDIERVIDDCRNAGFTAVMFQVRGNGTALWPSRLEVWSERFDHRDPGFDPLRVAIDAAHSRAMQLHAWVNVLPGWNGAQPPADPRQLWVSRPGWFLMDRKGDRQGPGPGKYLTLNPCLPEVRRYLADLCREIVEGYPIDGVHLDYVRFPDPVEGEDLGTDSSTLAAFTGATGARSTDADRLRHWQAECVTRTVEEIARSVKNVQGRPVLLTASVFADPNAARNKVRQDWPRWCRSRLLDAVFPMNYTEDDAAFARLCRLDVDLARGVPVMMGVGLFKHAGADQSTLQLDAALAHGARGVAVFNYRTLMGPVAADAAVGSWDQGEARRRITTWLLTQGAR